MLIRSRLFDLRAVDVATEDPGYVGATLAFRRIGASLRYVPVDAEGVLVEQIVEGESVPTLLHVTPTHQYPLGVRLSGPRRRELIELARTRGMLIVENEYDCEFHYAGTKHPPIFSSAPESTLLLTTSSQPRWPLPRRWRISWNANAFTSWPAQKIVEMLLVSGELDRHLRRVRRHYGAMRDTIRQRLAPHADAIELCGDEGGLHVAISGRDSRFDQRLREALRAITPERVLVSTGESGGANTRLEGTERQPDGPLGSVNTIFDIIYKGHRSGRWRRRRHRLGSSLAVAAVTWTPQ